MAEERVIPQLNTADEYVELFKLIKAFKYVQENAEALGVGSYRGEGADRKLVISDRDIINFIVDRHTELAVDKDGRAVQLYTGAPSREELAKAIQNALKLTGSRDLREALNNLKDNENLIKESYVEFKNRQDADVNAKEENLIAAAQSTKTSQKANSKIKRQRGWARFGKVATVLATIGLAGGYVLGSFGLAGGFAGLASISTMPFATLAVVGGIIAYNVGKSIVKKIWKNLNDRIDKANAVIKGEADVLGSDKNLEQAKTLGRENARALNVARSRINAISPQNEAAFELFAEGLEDMIGTSRGVDIAVLDAPEIGAERVVSEAEREGTPPEVEVTPREISKGEPLEKNIENTLVKINRENLKASDLEDDRTAFNKVEVGIQKFESDPATTRAAIRDYVRDVIYADDDNKGLEDKVVDSIYNTFVDEYETGDDIDAVHSIETISKTGESKTYTREEIKNGVNDYLVRRLAPPVLVRALDISEVQKKHKEYYPITKETTPEKYNSDYYSHYIKETLHDALIHQGIKEEDAQAVCQYLTAKKGDDKEEYMLPDSVKMPQILNLIDEIERAEAENRKAKDKERKNSLWAEPDLEDDIVDSLRDRMKADAERVDMVDNDENKKPVVKVVRGRKDKANVSVVTQQEIDAEKLDMVDNDEKKPVVKVVRGRKANVSVVNQQEIDAEQQNKNQDEIKQIKEDPELFIRQDLNMRGVTDRDLQNQIIEHIKSGEKSKVKLPSWVSDTFISEVLNSAESAYTKSSENKVHVSYNPEPDAARDRWAEEKRQELSRIEKMRGIKRDDKEAYATRILNGESMDKILEEIKLLKESKVEQMTFDTTNPEAFDLSAKRKADIKEVENSYRKLLSMGEKEKIDKNDFQSMYVGELMDALLQVEGLSEQDITQVKEYLTGSLKKEQTLPKGVDIQYVLNLLKDNGTRLYGYIGMKDHNVTKEELVRVLVEAKDKKNEYDISDVDLSGFVRE